MDEKRLQEIEDRIGHVASPEGAALTREVIAEVRRLRTRTERLEACAKTAIRTGNTQPLAKALEDGLA